MHAQPLLAGIFALPLLALPATAQDSVSKTPCLPGDALNPYDDAGAANGSAQEASYVLDLSTIQSSWGNAFGVGPVMKSSKTSSMFFTSLLSSQSLSRKQRRGGGFASGQYAHWTQPGFGVNGDPMINDPGAMLDQSSALGHQFGIAFAEFATTDGAAGYNGIIGGRVNLDPTDPTRLYVTRQVAAINGCDDTADISQFGFGAIDEEGNLHARADSFGSPGGCGLTILTGNNIFRFKLADRTPGALNVVSDEFFFPGSGLFDAPATELIVPFNPNTMVTPSVVPPCVTGGKPLFIGTDFGSLFWRGQDSASIAADSTQLSPLVVDTRGNISYTTNDFPFLDSDWGTAGILARDANSNTVFLNLWGIDDAGDVSGVMAYQLPAMLSDNCTGFTNPGASNAFTHTFSQTPFRGGNGQIALGKDQAGRLIAAAAVDHPVGGDQTNDAQYIAVARIDRDTGAAEWAIAAYNFSGGGGKMILDGPGGSPIGQMTDLSTITAGAQPGPSSSPPMIDGAGNILLVSAIEVFDPLGGPSDLTSGLVRAVYDPVNFCYELELLIKSGDVISGPNSGTDYQIGFIQIADSNSIGSGTAFSQNVSEEAHLGQTTVGLATSDPRTLGGIALSAEVIYDFDGDGTFVECSNDPTAPDQDYNALLYLGSIVPGTDVDGNGGADEAELLRADVASLSVTSGGTQTFTLQAGVEQAGNVYAMVGTFSGTSPGIVVDGLLLPINIDSYFPFTIQAPNTPPLSNFQGNLDAQGVGTAQLSIPAGTTPVLVGQTAHHAYAVIGFTPFPEVVLTSNAWPTEFTL